MAGPFEATGAQKGATRFGALGMGARQFTGLVTQRSPYRDGAVPYLVGKFYGGSRFDSIWDGMNREITQRLTDGRAPGSSVYNSNAFPAGNSFYPWKYIQNGVEKIRVLYDGQDGTIYDATAGQKSTLAVKGAGAGKARFLGVNTELFLADGVDQQKVVETGATWRASKNIAPGTLINQGATPGVVYMALGGMQLPIVATQVVAHSINSTHYIFIDPQQVPRNFANLVNALVTFSGLTVDTGLNGQTLQVDSIVSSTLGILAVVMTGVLTQAKTPDTGTASTGNGTTGATIPAFTPTRLAITADAGQQWKSYGTALQNWGLTAPTKTIKIVPLNGTRFWRPGVTLAANYSLLDSNGNIQVLGVSSPGVQTGLTYPVWATGGLQSVTTDGSIQWVNLGVSGTWAPSVANAGIASLCLLDSNGNLQQLTDGFGGNSAGSPPVWGTTLGATVTDGGLTWTCISATTAGLGSGITLSTQTYQYGFSLHGIDGSVSTASLPVLVQGGVLGVPYSSPLAFSLEMQVTLQSTIDPQTDQIWIWRTAQGKPTLVLEDQIPADGVTTTFLYGELGIPDVSATGSGQLNALIPAPVADANDPPQVGMTAPVYYQQRIWGIVDNMVVHSGGPDTITGNGNTAFAPLDEIPFLAQPVRLVPVLVQNGGLIVMTTSGIKIILGTGTQNNPYYVGDYLELVSVLGYDAVTVFYNQIFCMESNGKVSSLAIEYPFNPQNGYTEVGFPIGDQFIKVTTGGQNAKLFDPATSYVSWNANSSADTGMYVSDGAGHWFQMSLINPPESGILWNPLRTLQGGASAVQSVETTPGVHNLLIAPRTGTTGPILMRDTTGAVWTDVVAGTPAPYPAWDAKGVTLLASTGQWASIKHVSAKSKNTGGPRPRVSVLFNEIEPSAERPYIDMVADAGKSNDPSRNRASVSVYSDRYRLAQQGQETTGDCILVKFDYGAVEFGDELLDWAIYGAVHEEDEEQAEKATQ